MHDNLRAALAWSTAAPGGAETGLRLAGALWRFWYVRGYLAEGRRWLRSALERSEALDLVVRAKGLNAAGVLAWAQGDLDEAEARHEAALELRRKADDRLGIASSLNNLGIVARGRAQHL